MKRIEFSVFDELGNENKYEVILAYKSFKTQKNYLVYTDNTTTKDGELNMYAAIYDPLDDTVFEPVTTDAEWDDIKQKIEEMGGVVTS